MSEQKMKSAIVVGAGLAGLSAAYRLSRAGFAVTVLEKRDRVGGRVLTVRRDGYVIDAGPDAMTEGYRHYKALANELGLGGDFVPSSAVVGLVRDGRLLDIDTGSVASMLLTGALTWRAKLRFGWGLWRQRKLFSGVDSFRLTDSAAFDSAAENAEAFSRRAFGREATDYVIDPLIRLVAGSGAARVSRLGILGGLVNWSVPLMNIRGGLDVLPKALAKEVDVTTGVEVERVAETASGVAIGYRDAGGFLTTLNADACVIAATYDVARAIYPKLSGYVPDYDQRLSFLSLVSVSLAYKAQTRSRAYVVQVPTVELPETLLIFMQHNKAPDRVPEGHSLITLYTDGHVTRRYLEKSDEEITAWARVQIEKLCPELAGHFNFSSVSRWPIAGYLATPGFWTDTQKLLNALPQDSAVQIAGDLFGAGSMESAVTWGEYAAKRIIEGSKPN